MAPSLRRPAPSRRYTGRAGRAPNRTPTARAPLADPPCMTPPRSRGPRDGRSARPPAPSPRPPRARLKAPAGIPPPRARLKVLVRPKAPVRLKALVRPRELAGIPPPRCQLPWAGVAPGLLPRCWLNRRRLPRCRFTGRAASPCAARAAAAGRLDRAEPPPPLNFISTGREGRGRAGRDPLAEPPWVDPARRARAFSLGAFPVPLSRSTAPEPPNRAAAPASPGTPRGWPGAPPLADPPGKLARPWAASGGAASALARTTA